MSSSHQAQTVRFTVSGRVQRVGFRWYSLRTAERLQVAGWVRNLPDGRVEILAQGPESVLREFEMQIRQGPTFSRVENLEIVEISPELTVYKSFDIR